MSAVDRPTGPEWDLGKIAAAVKNGWISAQKAEELKQALQPGARSRSDRSAFRPQVPR